VQASETVGDISLLAGSEAYQAALSFYHYVKLLASQDVPRAKAVYEELKKRFPSTGRKKADAAE
jgi:phosphoribosyl-ATP pyrophosphohydrolase